MQLRESISSLLPMLNRLGRWFRGSAPSATLQSVKAWAKARGYQHRTGEESWGFRIDGHHGPHRWRMEYGRPQRPYVEEAELRLRLNLGLPRALNLMLLSRHVVDQLETMALDDYLQGSSSRLQHSAKEEARWLALYPKVALHAVSGLRRHFGMVGSSPEAAHQWLHGALGERLAALPGSGWAGVPLALTTAGGQIFLRLELREPQVTSLEEALSLFLLAADRAQEVLANWVDDQDDAWLSTTSIAWQGSELHVELPLELPPSSQN